MRSSYSLVVLVWVLALLLGSVVVLELFGDATAHDIAKALEGLVAVALPAIIAAAASPAKTASGSPNDANENPSDPPPPSEREPTGRVRREGAAPDGNDEPKRGEGDHRV